MKTARAALRPASLSIVVLFGTLALTGCRSDGGIGRADSPPSWSWTASRFSNQFDDNFVTTERALGNLPQTLADEWRRGWIDFGASNSLYAGEAPDYSGR